MPDAAEIKWMGGPAKQSSSRVVARLQKERGVRVFRGGQEMRASLQDDILQRIRVARHRAALAGGDGSSRSKGAERSRMPG